jgi:predicted dienelactone hydrolase
LRSFELVLIGIDFLILSSLFFRGRPDWLIALPVLALLALGLHLSIEKPRWQMVPLYILTVVMALLVLLLGFQPSSAWAAVLGLFLLVLLSLPPFLFPVPALPHPTGRYKVGTSSFYWVDGSRTELFNSPPGGPRRIMVQVWYPAEPRAGAQPALYLSNLDVAGPALARQLGLPSFVLSHIDLARTHSYQDAPAASGCYPVLVFSHGWTGFRAQNTYQMEELASQGYVVFSPDHTYGAAVTAFPDGTVALNNRDALPPGGISDEEYARLARDLGLTWTNDIRFVLDQAEKINQGAIQSPLVGRLDLERVGIFGHSTGGGAAVEVCYTDRRFKAGLAEDAWLVPYSREIDIQGLEVPFFYLQSQKWMPKPNLPLVQAVYKNSCDDRYRVKILGSAHYDFSDVPLLTPLAALLDLKGPIAARRMLSITNAYTQAFFDHYLKGLPAQLLDGSSSYFNEAKFEKIAGEEQ